MLPQCRRMMEKIISRSPPSRDTKSEGVFYFFRCVEVYLVLAHNLFGFYSAVLCSRILFGMLCNPNTMSPTKPSLSLSLFRSIVWGLFVTVEIRCRGSSKLR